MAVKKILNPNVENVVEESLAGYLAAYRKYYKRIGNYNAFKYRKARKNKTVLVIGGGSGHEPLFIGYCGAGLADAVACGNVCASPNPELIYKTARAVDQGMGVLFVYGCYAGDNLNFDMAEELCRADGIKTAHVRVWDDFLSAPEERKFDRRGIAGDVFVIKCAGAACDAGLAFDEVVTLPGNDKPTFTLADDELEFGMGLHGEPGIERTRMMTADKIVDRMYAELRNEMKLSSGERIAVLVNGLGSTPMMELNLVYFNLYKHLKQDGLSIHDSEIKTCCTCMEMGGFSITILRLDSELLHYYDMPCYSPYYAAGTLKENPSSVNHSSKEDFNEDTDEQEQLEFDEKSWTPSSIVRSSSGVLAELTVEDAKNMLLYIADKIILKKPYLTEVDSAIGDGDHGIGMAGGMLKAKKALLKMENETNVYSIFKTAGQAMLRSMGGASGVIFGSLYLAGTAEAVPKAVLTASDLAIMEKKSLEAIQARGGAQPGDKTMVDALSPAVDAMLGNQEKGLLKMLVAAENAAQKGLEDTKKYTAKFGRAKSLLEKAIGHQDAGAASVYFIFQGMREFVEDKMQLYESR